ncbi:MAG: hypothetical protein K0Q87_1594 [Neobacillus sp.]|jgi:cytochrome c556|nr:hypothetical protein [Neobacillus sp.]
MLKQALKKLQDEMSKDRNPYVEVIGQFLISHIKAYPEDAEKILANDKTISKSLDAMKNVAEKKVTHGENDGKVRVAVLTDEEGFHAIEKYFGIIEDTDQSDHTNGIEETVRRNEQMNLFDVSLDDLLNAKE